MREPVVPPGVPEPLDQELLAWAAGFFDGEGTTIARTDRRRRDYFQLDVSVPQSGPDSVPEVLVKFQRAMLGVGTIYPQPGSFMHKWSAGGRVAAEMSLALLWKWLGSVKRAQALAALEAVNRQYAEGRYRARAPRYRPRFIAHEPPSSSDPRSLQLAWAAGFLDAEGWFGVVRGRPRKDGSPTYRIRVSAPQHSYDDTVPEVLRRLQQILGGAIECHGDADDYKWVVYGRDRVARCVELMTPWLGEVKRAQVREAVARFDSQPRVRGTGGTCVRGHAYDGVVVRPSGRTVKVCNSCSRLRERANRAVRGGKPRDVLNRPPDPTRTYRVK